MNAHAFPPLPSPAKGEGASEASSTLLGASSTPIDAYAADRNLPVSFDINSLDTYKTAREAPYRLSTDAWRP